MRKDYGREPIIFMDSCQLKKLKIKFIEGM